MSDVNKPLVSTSAAGQLDLTDLKKLGRDSVFVGVAAALSYFGQHLVGIDLGASTALIVPIISVLIDAVYRYVKDNVGKEESK